MNNPVKYIDPSGYFSEDQIEGYLRKTYGDLWQQYWDAWFSDKVFWGMLLAAEYGDALLSVTEDLGAGVFHEDSGTFTFSGPRKLEEFQGYGPYMLMYGSGQNRLPDVAKQVSVNPVSVWPTESWTQPIYIYGQHGPSYYGRRTVSYRYDGYDRDLTAGDAMPFAIPAAWEVVKWRGGAKLAASALGKRVPWVLFALSAATAANNAFELRFCLQTSYSDERTFISPLYYGPYPAQP